MVRLYFGTLGARLTDPQWERAVHRALEAETFFPPPAALLRYGLAPDTAPAGALAGRAYDAILMAFERGERLGHRDVLERHGRAAADAFVAAGGVRSFEWCEPKNEPYRRRDFVSTFVEQVEVEPALALPPGEGARSLPPGEGGRIQVLDEYSPD